MRKTPIFITILIILVSSCTTTDVSQTVEDNPITSSVVQESGETKEPTIPSEEATVTVASSQKTETPIPTPLPEPTQTPEPRSMTPEQEAAYALLDRNAEKSTSMEEYPMVWTKEFTGESEGIRVTFALGFSEMVEDHGFHSVKGIEMTQEGIDAQVVNWLRLCHYRYNYVTSTDGNNEKISYEDYLQLLRQPEGGEIYMPVRESDGKGNWSVVWRYIDPRAGFALNYFPEAEEMPVKTNSMVTEREDGPMENGFIYTGFVMGADEKNDGTNSGRLMLVHNWQFFMDGPEFGKNATEEKKIEVGYKAIKAFLGSIVEFVNYSNECLLVEDLTKCHDDVDVSTEDILYLWEEPFRVGRNYSNGEGERPYTLIFAD